MHTIHFALRGVVVYYLLRGEAVAKKVCRVSRLHVKAQVGWRASLCGWQGIKGATAGRKGVVCVSVNPCISTLQPPPVTLHPSPSTRHPPPSTKAFLTHPASPT